MDNVSVSQILISIHETHKEFTYWLSIFAKELPGFDKFNQEDFMTIVSSSFQLGLHVKDLYFNNDLYVITSNESVIEKSNEHWIWIIGYIFLHFSE